jgi:glycosyltransferase involved in cell wall biosynthesis
MLIDGRVNEMSSMVSPIGALHIDVVVPVYNKFRFILDAVGSVADAVDAHPDARLFIVDNGSTDGSYELLLERFGSRANISRLLSGTIAAVRNAGAKQGHGPIISFIDCDCLIPQDYFVRLETVLSETQAEATGCLVLLPPNPTWVEAVWNRMHDDGVSQDEAWINSANFAVRRTIFEQVGGFNERLETGEDAELCQRIRRAGGRLVEDARLGVAHLDNAKTVGAFYRKERWRGLGMFGTFRIGSLDKPIVMTVSHLLALVAAVVVLGWAPVAFWIRGVVGAALVFAAPIITVAYRRRSSVRTFSRIRAVILYQLYYLGRINALAIIASRNLRGRVRRRRGMLSA